MVGERDCTECVESRPIHDDIVCKGLVLTMKIFIWMALLGISLRQRKRSIISRGNTEALVNPLSRMPIGFILMEPIRSWSKAC